MVAMKDVAPQGKTSRESVFGMKSLVFRVLMSRTGWGCYVVGSLAVHGRRCGEHACLPVGACAWWSVPVVCLSGLSSQPLHAFFLDCLSELTISVLNDLFRTVTAMSLNP